MAASIILRENFCDDIENYLIVCLVGMRFVWYGLGILRIEIDCFTS